MHRNIKYMYYFANTILNRLLTELWSYRGSHGIVVHCYAVLVRTNRPDLAWTTHGGYTFRPTEFPSHCFPGHVVHHFKKQKTRFKLIYDRYYTILYGPSILQVNVIVMFQVKFWHSNIWYIILKIIWHRSAESHLSIDIRLVSIRRNPEIRQTFFWSNPVAWPRETVGKTWPRWFLQPNAGYFAKCKRHPYTHKHTQKGIKGRSKHHFIQLCIFLW